MPAFSGENVLSELLGFAGLWVASRWKITPQLRIDGDGLSSSEDGGGDDSLFLGYFKRPTFLRMVVVTALVPFQILLVGADARSTWLIPLITIAVYTHARTGDQFSLSNPQSYAILSPSNWAKPKLDANEPLFVPAISVVATLLLSVSRPSLSDSFPSALSLFCFGAAFFVVLPYSARSSEDAAEKTSTHDGRTHVKSISLYAIGFCAVLLLVGVVWKTQMQMDLLVVIEIILRGAQAFGLIMFATENALAATSTITVASLASGILGDPFVVDSIGASLALTGSIAQVVLTAPKSNDKRTILFAFLFLPGLLLPAFQNVSVAPEDFKNHVINPIKQLPETLRGEAHPIEQLHRQWKQSFDKKLAGQSKTIKEATEEYRRRYNRRPPPGFDKWYRFAQNNEYIMIDEFDGLMESLKPFWDVTPADLLKRSRSAMETGGELAEIEIVDNKIERMSWDHWYTDAIKTWFEKFERLRALPDFNFTLNALDEPRTVFTPTYMEDTTKPKNGVPPKKTKIDKNKVEWVDVSREPSYPEISASCPVIGFDDESPYMFLSHNINFLNITPSGQDVCVSESLRTQHGFFMKPTTMKMTHNVVPLFSQAVPQRYSDIVLPTPFYYTTQDNDKNDNLEDLAWNEKVNQTYWAGGSTGGWLTMENWKEVHRTRIALMTSSNSTEPVTVLKKEKKKWTSYQTTYQEISEYFDIQITRFVQCDDEVCQEMEQYFDPELQSAGNALKYKYVFDIDGNSYTGRYYRLLRSNSCVIKSTIFREWHDDLLTPWVHYIPLSNSASEFGEMMRFLIAEPGGDAIGEAIAKEGKAWANKSLRKEDMEVVALRLFMEYGRLFDENRDTNVFYLDGEIYGQK